MLTGYYKSLVGRLLLDGLVCGSKRLGVPLDAVLYIKPSVDEAGIYVVRNRESAKFGLVTQDHVDAALEAGRIMRLRE